MTQTYQRLNLLTDKRRYIIFVTKWIFVLHLIDVRDELDGSWDTGKLVSVKSTQMFA